MTSRDFCYWLQGYLEINNEADSPVLPTSKQLQVIVNHLNLVFKHDIDPSMGPPEHQDELNDIHKKTDQLADTIKNHIKQSPLIRC